MLSRIILFQDLFIFGKKPVTFISDNDKILYSDGAFSKIVKSRFDSDQRPFGKYRARSPDI